MGCGPPVGVVTGGSRAGRQPGATPAGSKAVGFDRRCRGAGALAGDAPGSRSTDRRASVSGSTGGEQGRRLDAESRRGRRGAAVCWFRRGRRVPLIRARQDMGEEGILYIYQWQLRVNRLKFVGRFIMLHHKSSGSSSD
jgi:hypothetical protein